MVWKWLKTVEKAIVDVTKFAPPQQRYTPETTVEIPENSALTQRKEDMQLLEIKLEYLKRQENFNFQAEESRLNHERVQELQAFIQRAEDARLQRNLEFQQWRLAQEKSIQLELLDLNHQLQRELVAYQRQSSLKIVEEQKRLENSPIWLVASDILSSHPRDDVMPLRVVFAPPKLQFERFANAATAAKDFPEIELTIAEGLRQFFIKYSNSGRSIDFLAGAWVSKSFHSEASIKALFGVLKSEPTLVLESEVDGDYLNFRTAYWGLNWSKYRYDPVISKLPYRDILYEAAKSRARKWTETRAKLIAAGVSPEEADENYGQDNVKNWEILQREEVFRQAGVDASELSLNYIVNKKDFEELCQFLIIYHCIFAGLVADEYFLFQYNLPPLLPQLLPELTEKVPEDEISNDMIKAVILYYENVYEALGTKRSSWIPEMALDLAHSLAHLPNKVWAKEQLAYSIKSWLQQRDLPQPEDLDSLIIEIESVLTIDDREYVERLNQCLKVVGIDKYLSVVEACYNQAMSHYDQKEYVAAIADFERAIRVNPDWEQAYYHRGQAYVQLGQYQKAIEDYTQVLRINPDRAEAYSCRGDAHYKLGDHDDAIVNYDRAIAIDPDFVEAIRNRDVVQGVLNELKRKGEEERKRKFENFSLAETLTGHSNTVRCVAISPGGKILASGSYDDTIRLWELPTGKPLRTIRAHADKDVNFLVMSPDGETLISGGDDKTIKTWQLSTGQGLRTLTGHSSFVNSLAISPDGQTLVSGGGEKTIKLWQLNTGKEIRTLKGHSGYVYSVAITPDGETLVSGSHDKTIKIWQMSTGKEIRTLKGHSGYVYSVAISPDGQTLVSGSHDNTIRIWQLNTGKEVRILRGHSGYVYSVAISPDGQTLVSGSHDNTIKIWQLSTGEELRTLTGHSGWICSLAISPDGQALVSASGDNTIKLWRVV